MYMTAGNVNLKRFSCDDVTMIKSDIMDVQEKINGIVPQKSPDNKTLDFFEKKDVINEILCECYPNYQILKEMPKSVFGDQFGYDMQKDISGRMNDFYSGKISQSELEDFFKECCTSMRMYRTKQHQTSGNNLEDNKQIISEMYEMFAKENQRAARIANYNEGISVNEKYGGRKDDWAYYNSDYYYQCLDTKEILRNITEDIENKWGIPFINLEEIEANSKYTLDGGFDFNSGWNFSYQNQAGMASMEDESIEPPENFRFFYKEECSFHQGALSVSLDGHEYRVEVPFSASNQIYYINTTLRRVR